MVWAGLRIAPSELSSSSSRRVFMRCRTAMTSLHSNMYWESIPVQQCGDLKSRLRLTNIGLGCLRRRSASHHLHRSICHSESTHSSLFPLRLFPSTRHRSTSSSPRSFFRSYPPHTTRALSRLLLPREGLHSHISSHHLNPHPHPSIPLNSI